MSTFAEATIRVKVMNLGSWGDECTAGQIKDQARRAAMRKLTELLDNVDFEIIGQPEIRMVNASLDEA